MKAEREQQPDTVFAGVLVVRIDLLPKPEERIDLLPKLEERIDLLPKPEERIDLLPKPEG